MNYKKYENNKKSLLKPQVFFHKSFKLLSIIKGNGLKHFVITNFVTYF